MFMWRCTVQYNFTGPVLRAWCFLLMGNAAGWRDNVQAQRWGKLERACAFSVLMQSALFWRTFEHPIYVPAVPTGGVA